MSYGGELGCGLSKLDLLCVLGQKICAQQGIQCGDNVEGPFGGLGAIMAVGPVMGFGPGREGIAGGSPDAPDSGIDPIPSTGSLANELADATGGGVQTNKGGYTINVPYGSRGIVVRIMDEGGTRTNYCRVSVPGKATYTRSGEVSADRALTHIPISGTSFNDILGVMTKIQGGG